MMARQMVGLKVAHLVLRMAVWWVGRRDLLMVDRMVVMMVVTKVSQKVASSAFHWVESLVVDSAESLVGNWVSGTAAY